MPFKIYADFKSNVKKVKCSYRGENTSYTEKYQYHIPRSFAYKVVMLMITLLSQLFFIEVKMQSINSLMQFLKSMIIAGK